MVNIHECVVVHAAGQTEKVLWTKSVAATIIIKQYIPRNYPKKTSWI